jgi:tRNA G18 (ribose-2'-O)-methylase SpoU
VLAADGAVWVLVETAYPGNTGFAIRTAEVTGAGSIFVDNDFEHEGRREAMRASMRADRFMPVFWEPALPVIAEAREAGRRCLAIEDVGTEAPWEADLSGPVLFVVGGERHGIPAPVLDACHSVLRIPMHGFIPSYNLQAAMAVVAGERLRQLAEKWATTHRGRP